MRSVIVTIMKINEEEEASTECLDVLQNIIISKININIEKENNFIKSRFEFNEKRNSEKKYEINFKSKNKMFNKICKQNNRNKEGTNQNNKIYLTKLNFLK